MDSADLRFIDEWARNPATGERLTDASGAPYKALGYEGVLPVHIPGDEWDIRADQRSLTQKWLVPYSSVSKVNGKPNYSIFPSPGDSHPSYNWMDVLAYQPRQIPNHPKLAIVKMLAEQVDPAPLPVDASDPDSDPQVHGGGNPPTGVDPSQLPEDVVIPVASPQRIDITRHPLWRTENPAWGNKSMREMWDDTAKEFDFSDADMSDAEMAQASDDLNGLRNFIAGGLQVRALSYSFTDPENLALQALIGELQLPPGETGTSANNWLILGASANPVNGYWCTEVLYQFSEREFLPWLHQ